MQTVKILFVCHGNICRSPMAEFIMKELVRRRGLEARFEIASAATSTEEIGEPLYGPAARCLSRNGIPYEHREARQLRRGDSVYWDYIIGTDAANMRNIRRMIGTEAADAKAYKMLEFADSDADVADPWYTGDFDTTFDDLMAGCRGLLAHLGC
ncbi:MAG: low molecular weight phosphotyrosine protein phosphatase [Eggerthellaceae bacterium]|nr:low molecular weight phosphotyrosine protein phosphatase [Eggerthellaceae bacterium]